MLNCIDYYIKQSDYTDEYYKNICKKHRLIYSKITANNKRNIIVFGRSLFRKYYIAINFEGDEWHDN